MRERALPESLEGTIAFPYLGDGSGFLWGWPFVLVQELLESIQCEGHGLLVVDCLGGDFFLVVVVVDFLGGDFFFFAPSSTLPSSSSSSSSSPPFSAVAVLSALAALALAVLAATLSRRVLPGSSL